jgi:hypothetical protein
MFLDIQYVYLPQRLLIWQIQVCTKIFIDWNFVFLKSACHISRQGHIYRPYVQLYQQTMK